MVHYVEQTILVMVRNGPDIINHIYNYKMVLSAWTIAFQRYLNIYFKNLYIVFVSLESVYMQILSVLGLTLIII